MTKDKGEGRAANSALAALDQAVVGSDEDGTVSALLGALKAGEDLSDIKAVVLRAMCRDGGELHSLLYASAAFDLARTLGPEAGRYPLAAAALQIARQPKNALVADGMAGVDAAIRASPGGRSIATLEAALFAALDAHEVSGSMEAAARLLRVGKDPGFVIHAFAKWAARLETIEQPAGYVSHLPLQLAAAGDLLSIMHAHGDAELLMGYLAYCQITLSKSYRTRPVKEVAKLPMEAADALTGLRSAIHRGDAEEAAALCDAAPTRARFVEDIGRTIMRCGLEAAGPLSHRFTLADAARRVAAESPRPVARALLKCAAASIAHGYKGPKRLLEVRDLPLPRPGSSDYAGRLLVGLTSGNLSEAHAALRGFFEGGTSPRQSVVPFLDACSQVDAHNLRSDHPYVLTQCVWRAVKDGFFAADALPLMAELAAVTSAAPKDHELIARVEDALQASA